MPTPVSDFGRYLRSVEERDIDLLLMEEFHVVPAFATWFAERVGLGPATVFDGAWHSLSDEDGETDLLLRVRVASERVAVLIENKVAASEQEEQDLRYGLRAVRAQEAGRYDRFVTAICAPQVYLDGLSADSAYEHRVAYEAVLDWYAGQEGPRAEWRRAILREAIEQGRRGYVMKVHAGKTAFHRAYWEHLQAHHPELVMARPGAKGPKSDWMLFKGIGFPKGVKLVHKNDQGCVDLEFERTLATDLAKRRRADWPEGVRVLTRGQSAALSLPVPRCDMDLPLSEQLANIEVALAVALKLVPCAGPQRSASSGT
ncbi:MAG: PD-(D/E)XK nuclease family protein [Methylobacterium sp.]|uniref:hypothetical protein n=1 Tax=Methylobacterium sp. TaxID=409 RepID=UPI0025F9015D|nr:hypothetical protein [Methylobacterium sp.]MBX9934330.1 PD-(D/E)XK nuclease family protein [Methylobacterium sp.]